MGIPNTTKQDGTQSGLLINKLTPKHILMVMGLTSQSSQITTRDEYFSKWSEVKTCPKKPLLRKLC